MTNGKQTSILLSSGDNITKRDVLFILGEEKAIEGFKKLKT